MMGIFQKASTGRRRRLFCASYISLVAESSSLQSTFTCQVESHRQTDKLKLMNLNCNRAEVNESVEFGGTSLASNGRPCQATTELLWVGPSERMKSAMDAYRAMPRTAHKVGGWKAESALRQW